MAYTVKQVRELVPGVQFCGGVGVVRDGVKPVEIGRVAADGEFIPSVPGKLLLESANASASVKPAEVEKPKRVPKAKKVEVLDEPALELEDL